MTRRHLKSPEAGAGVSAGQGLGRFRKKFRGKATLPEVKYTKEHLNSLKRYMEKTSRTPVLPPIGCNWEDDE